MARGGFLGQQIQGHPGTKSSFCWELSWLTANVHMFLQHFSKVSAGRNAVENCGWRASCQHWGVAFFQPSVGVQNGEHGDYIRWSKRNEQNWRCLYIIINQDLSNNEQWDFISKKPTNIRIYYNNNGVPNSGNMSMGQSRAGFVGDRDMRKWSILGVLTGCTYLWHMLTWDIWNWRKNTELFLFFRT